MHSNTQGSSRLLSISVKRVSEKSGLEGAKIQFDDYMLGESADLIRAGLRAHNVLEILDFGCSAYQMCLVGRGGSSGWDGFISGDYCPMPAKRKTAEELAAGYLYVTEAGGVAVDFSGSDITGQEIGYHLGKTFNFVIASTPQLADQIIEVISRVGIPPRKMYK